ncbi:hypothetical protein [Pseudomonas jinjuensis]|uniref:Uncharacterized protein n=1 Tax=Pseudomonas jinjuensis TaxID=198616 RepID=A0A1G9YPS2_9PSED|nr:hypothetical protein [Pseudomonas jinjuensis]SDN10541.1 hypothetical protein SAMN05216193_101135 [Pseudomonas jinjuensis]
MPSRAFRAALIALSALCSTLAMARVDVRPAQHKSLGPVLAVRVSEDIAPGDYEALIRGIRENPGKYEKKLVLLDSIGGSVAEAIRMGRLLRDSGFDALVPANAVCQGACVYLLAAGNARTVRGHVGLHRPYYPAGDSAAASAHGTSRYSPAAYLREMDVSASLLEDMNGIAPHDMRVLSPGELARYRLVALPRRSAGAGETGLQAGLKQ